MLPGYTLTSVHNRPDGTKKAKDRVKLNACANASGTIKLLLTSDLPDPRSGSGSGRIWPFFAWIRIRPDINLKKKSGSGSGQLLI